jgi:hypothetical protein
LLYAQDFRSAVIKLIGANGSPAEGTGLRPLHPVQVLFLFSNKNGFLKYYFFGGKN